MLAPDTHVAAALLAYGQYAPLFFVLFDVGEKNVGRCALRWETIFCVFLSIKKIELNIDSFASSFGE